MDKPRFIFVVGGQGHGICELYTGMNTFYDYKKAQEKLEEYKQRGCKGYAVFTLEAQDWKE